MMNKEEQLKNKIEMVQSKLDIAKRKKKELESIKDNLDMLYISSKKEPLDIPYVPSSTEKVNLMIELADLKPGQKAADLGSGDGRVLIAMAKKGAYCFGFEIEPERVELAKKNIQKEKLFGKILVSNESFWDINLEWYDVITLYGITSIMERLEKKMLEELKPGARVISNRFTFPNWNYEKEINDVYLYVRK